MIDPKSLSTAFEPRRWQQEAVTAWASNGFSGIAQVVTGAGKTNFALLCIQRALGLGRADSFTIVVPTLALLDQWYIVLRDDLGVPGEDITVWSGKSKPTGIGLANVMVINTARSVIPGLKTTEGMLLVVDECHRVGSEINSDVLRPTFAATLGMSATPESDYDARLDEVLIPALGTVFFRYDINDAKRDGIVAEFDLINVRVALLGDEKRRYDRLTQRIARLIKQLPKGQALNDAAVASLLRQRARGASRARLRVPTAVRLLESHKGARTLVFHESIEDATAIHQVLVARGHSAALYHSHLGPGMRWDNLRLFRRGAYDVLVTCRALDEGINIPEVEVAIVASATASTRQRVQRLGRVLRPAPGKERALVYTIYATDLEERRLRREAQDLSARRVEWQKVHFKRA